jgi:hypothetical protein
MKSVPMFSKISFVGGFMLLAAANLGWAASTNATIVARAKTADAGKATLTAHEILEQPLPESVFVVPRKAVEGKDPFNPRSTRVYVTEAPKVAPKVSLTSELTLKGISGTADRPLAIINNITFAVGETNDIVFKEGRLQMVCTDINMATGTVMIQVGAEQRALRLQP